MISTLWPPVPPSGIQTSRKLRCSSIPCACTPLLPSRVSERACFPSLSIQQPKDESQVARTRTCERRFVIFGSCNKMYKKEECYSTRYWKCRPTCYICEPFQRCTQLHFGQVQQDTTREVGIVVNDPHRIQCCKASVKFLKQVGGHSRKMTLADACYGITI